jgi:hypothetical protein
MKAAVCSYGVDIKFSSFSNLPRVESDVPEPIAHAPLVNTPPPPPTQPNPAPLCSGERLGNLRAPLPHDGQLLLCLVTRVHPSDLPVPVKTRNLNVTLRDAVRLLKCLVSFIIRRTSIHAGLGFSPSVVEMCRRGRLWRRRVCRRGVRIGPSLR